MNWALVWSPFVIGSVAAARGPVPEDSAVVISLIDRVPRAADPLWEPATARLDLDLASLPVVADLGAGGRVHSLPVAYDRTAERPVELDPPPITEGSSSATLRLIAGVRFFPAERLADCSDLQSRMTRSGRRLFSVPVARDITLSLERFGSTAVLEVEGEKLTSGQRQTVGLLVDGRELEGRWQRRGEFDIVTFALPQATGLQPVTLTVDPAREATDPGITGLRLIEGEGRDLLLTDAPPAGTRVQLRPAPPGPVIEWRARGDPEVRLLLLEGTAAVVLEDREVPATLGHLEVDGVRVTAARKSGRELSFRVPETAVGLLHWIGPAPERCFIVQPAARRTRGLNFGRRPGPQSDRPRRVESVQIGAETRRAALLSSESELALGRVEAGRIELELAALDLFPSLAPRERPWIDVCVRVLEDETEEVLASFELQPKDLRELSAWRPVEFKIRRPGQLSIRRRAASTPTTDQFSLVLVGSPRLVRSGPATRPNLLIYLIDTLRADRLSCFGCERSTSPNIDRVAAESLVFERAYSQAPWTRPSVATLFTGQLQSYHGVAMSTGLEEEHWTLAESFQQQGYHTGAFIANLHVHGPTLQFEQGFHRFVGVPEEDGRFPRADRVHALADPFLAEVKDRPFFLYVHTIDPHWPYDPPPQTRGTFAPSSPSDLEEDELPARDILLSRYDEEILFNDACFGGLIDRLRQLGLYENTAILFLADHGEEIREHGSVGHLGRLWEEVLHVPLILKLPGAEPKAARIPERVRLLDLWPTLARLFGLTPPERGPQGRDLAPLWTGQGDWTQVPVVAEDRDGGLLAFLHGPWKLVDGPGHERWSTVKPPLLFQVVDDPAEQTNLSGTLPEVMSALRTQLEAVMRQYDEAGFVRRSGTGAELPEEMRRALSLLGYVQEDRKR